MRNFILGHILCVFIFSSCSSDIGYTTSMHTEEIRQPIQHTSERYRDLEKFFRQFLFYHKGVYTLLGSKPITTFEIYDINQSDASYKDLVKQQDSFVINKGSKVDMDFYSTLEAKQKAQSFLVDDHDYIFDALFLWDHWEQFVESQKLSKRFLLIKRRFSEEEQKDLPVYCKSAYEIIFVNVLSAACVVERYYEQFKKIMGYDFNPLEEVLNMQRNDSALLNLLCGKNCGKNPRLQGLLYGYGWENSLIFEWCMQKERFNQDVSIFLNQISSPSDRPLETHRDILMKDAPFSYTNFPLPRFASFQLCDSNIKKYEEERKRIMEYYQGKDFVQANLEILIEKPANN